MRILIATDTYYPHVNGASYFSQRLARRLQDRGHDILVVAPAPSFRNADYEHDGIDVCGLYSIPVFVNDFRITLPVFIGRHVDRAVARFKPDIVHVQGHFFVSRAAFSSARKRGIPVIGTNHFMPENLSHYGRLPRRFTRWAERKAWDQMAGTFNRYDCITAPTRSAADLLRRIGIRQAVHPVSNGIDLARFHPGPRDESLRKKYGLAGKPLLLFVGRMDKEKNIGLILRAVALARKQADFQFAAAGRGAELERLRRLAAELDLGDSARFLGFVPNDDLPGLYRLADAFIIACEVELQSIATMEAMASGLPVIAVRALALPELVEDGRNGYLARPGDERDLAGKIVLMFADPVRQKLMGRESLIMIAPHDIDKVMERFESLYESLRLPPGGAEAIL